MDLKGNKRNSCNSEIDAAEARRLRLLAEKESVCRTVDSNSQLKAQLQKQLQSIMWFYDTNNSSEGMGLKTTQL